jgi:serine phosphatase RsbU (regulator of sigma subunit)
VLTVPIPADDEQRVADLARLGVMLSEPDHVLDAITSELARVFDVPSAAISFIDRETQHYKSGVGIPEPFNTERVEPRAMSICSFVVGDNDMLVVEDLAADDRFRETTAVTDLGLRFYAGTPLRADSGRAVGSLCILDRRPRTISDRERELLRILAEGVMAQVKLQVASRRIFDYTTQIEEEMRRAVKVQRFLLPPSPVERSGWVIRHLYRPMAHLGGDFLDVTTRRDGRVVVLIADVAGHGADAALTAAMIKTSFARAVDLAEHAFDVLGLMNRELSAAVPPGQFITAAAAMLGVKDGSIEVSAAGHPPPMMATASRVEPIAFRGHVPLAIDPDSRFDECSTVTLDEGDRMLFYTDGAFEVVAAGGGDARLGLDGLGALVKDAVDGSEDAFLQRIVARIERFAGGRIDDDVALLEVMRKKA